MADTNLSHVPGRRTGPSRALLLALLPAALAACSGEGVTTAEVQRAAKERVQQELQLSPETALFTDTFVGGERDGSRVLCGTVSGRRADGAEITPRRFIVGVESSEFLAFGPAHSATYETAPDPFAAWAELCPASQS